MSISYWLDGSRAKSVVSYDAVVVGAGIAGLSTAYWLQHFEPGLKIAIIEKNRVGFGASGRNAGFLTCGSVEHWIKLTEKFGEAKALEIWRFSEMNHELLRQHVIEDQGTKLEYSRLGACTIAPSDERWATQKLASQQMSARGIATAELNASELSRDYGLNGYPGGILYKGDASINPIYLLERMRSKLKVDLIEATEVFELGQSAGKVRIKTDHGTFESDRAYLTVNAYVPLLRPKLAKVVEPARAQILMTKPLRKIVKTPCYLTKYLCYFRQLQTGELLIGGFRNLAVESEKTMTDQTTETIQMAIFNFARATFGAEIEISRSWAGIMAMTADGQMLIGEDGEIENLHVLAGCSGHGMGLSFHAAKALVESSLKRARVPDHLDINRIAK